MNEEEIKQILWINGLKNAVEFGGKPNKKAVMGKLMAEREDLRSEAKRINPLLEQVIKEIEKLSVEEQKAELILEICPNCGAKLPLENVKQDGSVECEYCFTTSLLPKTFRY